MSNFTIFGRSSSVSQPRKPFGTAALRIQSGSRRPRPINAKENDWIPETGAPPPRSSSVITSQHNGRPDVQPLRERYERTVFPPSRPVRAPLKDISNDHALYLSGGRNPEELSRGPTPRPKPKMLKLPGSASSSSPSPPPTPLAKGYSCEEGEYAPEIIDLWFRMDHSLAPTANYMETQPDLSNKMRGILVDWLVELQRKYDLKSTTLFLSVCLIDRYLSKVKINRTQLQLLGLVSFYVAAKFEEVQPPPLRSLAYMTDGACTVNEIVQFEARFLAVLDFKVLTPTANIFLDHFVHELSCSQKHEELAKYLLELGLLDVGLLRHSPAMLAAAALAFSFEVIEGPGHGMTKMVASRSRQSVASLECCVDAFQSILAKVPKMKLTAVQKKFSEKNHLCIAQRVSSGF